jgi:glucokinase
LADIGGTCQFRAGDGAQLHRRRVGDGLRRLPTLGAALVAYLSQPATVAAGGYQARFAGIAIANPIDGDWVTMTNHHWSFSIEAVCSQFSLKSLVVVNDFALASALPYSMAHRTRSAAAWRARAPP